METNDFKTLNYQRKQNIIRKHGIFKEHSCLHMSIAIVSSQLNGFNYSYLTLIILLIINYLFEDGEVVSSIAIYH